MSDPTMTDVKVPGTDWMDDYDQGGSSFVPPPQPKTPGEGGKRPRYVQFLAQAPGVEKIAFRDKDGKFLTTKEGYLKFVVEGLQLVESGYSIQQTHVSTTQYKKYGKDGQPTGELRNASPALDYLHAFGVDLKPATAEEYEQYCQSTSDRQCQITGDWSAYDKDAGADVASKWEDFPEVPTDPENEDAKAFARMYPGADPAKSRLPYITKGSKRFWARLSVKRWVSAIPEKK